MKTLLFAPLFLDGPDRFERNVQWLNYYTNLNHLKFDEIFMVDNASDPKLLEEFQKQFPKVKIHKCDVRLERISSNAYGYWYRAFGIAAKYAKEKGFDKIVHCDSDVYVLNKRICDYVNKTDTGWNCFWCDIHKYPESTFQIIGKDQFDRVYKFMTEEFLKFYPIGIAEIEIPWTHIEKGFKGDRYGEKLLQQTPDMEWYGQKPTNIKVTFNE